MSFSKVISLLLAVMLTGTTRVLAISVPEPAPKLIRFSTPSLTYPRAAKSARIEGSGTVKVTYDPTGHADHAEMIASTGSLILDRSTVLSVQKLWHSSGGQWISKTTAVDYQLPPLTEKPKPVVPVPPLPPGMVFFAPHPPYPALARQQRAHGAVTIRVIYGASGGWVQTKIVRSSGDAILDGYSADYIRMYWRCYNKEPTVHTTVLDYVLR